MKSPIYNIQEEQVSNEKASTYGGILGADREIPKDRKSIVTDLALDTWISSHYGIKLDRIPSGRAGKIPYRLLQRMKKTYEEKLSSFDHEPQYTQKANDDSDSGSYHNVKGETDYRLHPPKTYRHVTYPVNSNEKSLVDHHIDELK